MSNAHKRRLDALEAAFNQPDQGPPCDRCGAPGTVWRPAVWIGLDGTLGECEGCGRAMDLRLNRPVEPTMHTMILTRGEPPEGWKPLGPE
jgi:hypothetical protein